MMDWPQIRLILIVVLILMGTTFALYLHYLYKIELPRRRQHHDWQYVPPKRKKS